MIIKISLIIAIVFILALVVYFLMNYLKSMSYEADYQVGIDLFENRKYEQAEQSFEKVLQKKEDHYLALYNCGLTCLYLKKYKKAQNLFQKAAAIDKTDSDLFFNLGLVYQHENDLTKAVEYYKKALSINQNDLGAMFNLALVYKQNKKYDKSLKFISKAIEADPKNKDYHLALGILYHEMRNEEGKNEYLDFAIDSFNEVLKLDSANETALKELCFCHSRRGHVKDTIENCEKFLEKTNNTEIRTLLALAYFCLKNFKNAIEQLLKVKESTDASDETELYLAYAYDKSGQKAEGLKHYNQFISKKPNHYAIQQLKNYFEKA